MVGTSPEGRVRSFKHHNKKAVWVEAISRKGKGDVVKVKVAEDEVDGVDDGLGWLIVLGFDDFSVFVAMAMVGISGRSGLELR